MQRFLSVKEFAETYGVGRTRIYELLNGGLIEGRKFGGRTLITTESAEAWAVSLPKFEEINP